jgi:hypothetical protein
VQANHTFHAVYVEVSSVTITKTPAGAGTVTISDGPWVKYTASPSSFKALPNKLLTFNVVAASGKTFNSVYLDGTKLSLAIKQAYAISTISKGVHTMDFRFT